MSGYQNAVTDKLIVVEYPEYSTVCVSSKHSSAKYYKRLQHNEVNHEVKALLSSSIFASTSLIHANGGFTLCPNDTPREEFATYYQLTYNRSVEPKAHVLDKDYTVLFTSADQSAEWKTLLVEPEELTDLDILHSYKSGLTQSNAIYFSKLDGELLIRVYSAQNLLLANRFSIDSKDDIFYFIMLAVEQLQIDINKVHFELIGHDEEYEELKRMFSNYLPMLLKLPLLEMDCYALNDQSKQEFLNDWFTQVAMQCV